MLAAALLALCAVAESEAGSKAVLAPHVPRTGLWAPRPGAAKPVAELQRHRPNLWSRMFTPSFPTPISKGEHAALTTPVEILRQPPHQAAAPTRPPPMMAHVPTVPPPLLLPPPKPFQQLPPQDLWKPPPPLALTRQRSRVTSVEQEASVEASQEAMEASDPILAKLDNIAAALHAMRKPQVFTPEAQRIWEPQPQLGAAQLSQNLRKARLPAAQEVAPVPAPHSAPPPLPAPPQVRTGPAPAKAAARTAGTPLPGAFVPPAAPAPALALEASEARPELSALRRQPSAHGLNRLFGEAPTAKPHRKASVLSLARVVGRVQRSAPFLDKAERWRGWPRAASLASAYGHP